MRYVKTLSVCTVLNLMQFLVCFFFFQKENLQHSHETVTTLLFAKKSQISCIDIILARGHISIHKHTCFNLNRTSFTSLHFQDVLLALWSLLPFEQQVPLYWIGKNLPGEGFGSLSPCSIIGTYMITTYLFILRNTTLTQNKLLQKNKVIINFLI